MIHLSSKTAAILAAFMAVVPAAVMMGCGSEKAAQSSQSQVLTDENGNQYTLTKNPDGTETARWEDGREVTFQRDSDDNVHYVSGLESLLPMMLMSYFLFHGIGAGHGYYNRNSTVLNRPPAYEQRQSQTNTTTTNRGSTVQQGTTTQGGKTTVTAPGGKSGFGGAGVRSGAS